MGFREEAARGPILRTPSSAPLILGLISTWLGVAAGAALSLPFRFALAPGEQILDTAAVSTVILPLAVSSILLDEGPGQLIRGASRDLRASRALVACFPALLNMGIAAIVASVSALPVEPYLRDVAILWAAFLVGAATRGVGEGWVAPVLVVIVFSAPGLVPFDVNILYRRQGGELFSVLLLVGAVALFVLVGSRSRDAGPAGFE